VCILVSLLPVPLMLVVAMFIAVPRTHVVETNTPMQMPRVEIRPTESGMPAVRVEQVRVANARVVGGVGPMWSMVPCVGILLGPLGLLGTVLGWVAFGQIRSSNGALKGVGLALFDGLFYPVVLGGMVMVGVVMNL
jgi:hypothetical protein